MSVVLNCRACAKPFDWTGLGRKPYYCKDEACHRMRASDRAYRYYMRTRWKGIRKSGRTSPEPAAPALPRRAPQCAPESPAAIEAMLAKARQLRITHRRMAS